MTQRCIAEFSLGFTKRTLNIFRSVNNIMTSLVLEKKFSTFLEPKMPLYYVK